MTEDTPRPYSCASVDEAVARALERDRVVDITTTGRRSGRPHRVEIWFHNLDGRIYVTGLPGRRSWYANLRANPELTFHVKQSAEADLPARARPITGPEERREVLTRIVGNLGRTDLDAWLARSPLVEIELL
jgi:deazaflavin-dependent oxidoreductase (nitroreductase family)